MRYEDILTWLNNRGVEYHTIKNFTIMSSSHPNVFMRHDIDAEPIRTLDMLGIEKIANVKSSIYIKPEYIISDFYDFEDFGFEFGYHCTHEVDNMFVSNVGKDIELFKRFNMQSFSLHGWRLNFHWQVNVAVLQTMSRFYPSLVEHYDFVNAYNPEWRIVDHLPTFPEERPLKKLIENMHDGAVYILLIHPQHWVNGEYILDRDR